MTWEDFVAENEGPELDAARARYRDDEPPACGVCEPRRPLPPDAVASSKERGDQS